MSSFHVTGYAIVREAVDAARCDRLISCTGALDLHGPGSRCLLEHRWCRELAADLRASTQIGGLMPAAHVAVQCTYFEKSGANNWLVPVHQDLSMPVAQPAHLPGWGPWSTKEGLTFVQPPVALLEQLIAVRVHLDPCGGEDGPLHVVPGTHAQGVIGPERASALRSQEEPCLARVGDALVMRPLLLHRSGKSTGSSRRRVLHLLYAPASPAPGVRWRRTA